VTVVEGDVLQVSLPSFSRVIAIPPYYLSSRLVTWLLERRVKCAVLILQKEFAEKLVASVGTDDYGWLTVVASQLAETELLDDVPKSMFYPQPEVDSVIVRMALRKTPLFEVEDEVFFKRMVRWLFTQRNKKVSNALAPFLRSTLKMPKDEAEKLASTFPFGEKRARGLSPRAFGDLANALTD
jgi:16S rRNA (adenine1518-N6/adenine1519-N6)-dimethyltransferase